MIGQCGYIAELPLVSISLLTNTLLRQGWHQIYQRNDGQGATVASVLWHQGDEGTSMYLAFVLLARGKG